MLTKAVIILVAGMVAVRGFVWWHSYMGRPLKTTIPEPWTLTPGELDALVDMPDHLVLYGSDAEFNAWLQRRTGARVPLSY